MFGSTIRFLPRQLVRGTHGQNDFDSFVARIADNTSAAQLYLAAQQRQADNVRAINYDARATMLDAVDPHSSTPGRQAMTWRSLEEQMNDMNVANDVSSTVVEIDTESRYETIQPDGRAQANSVHFGFMDDAYGQYRPPDPFRASQFTWTWLCPSEGCGWQETSDYNISRCRRCTQRPNKMPTYLGRKCHWYSWEEQQAMDWYFFCHTCRYCTWRRWCCGTECVDVYALKQAEIRRSRF